MPAARSSASTCVASAACSGRVVAQRVELVVEAAEVVDRLVRAPASSTGARARVWAETATMAFGRPKAASMAGPRRCMKAPASRGSSAVIGEPWEMKIGLKAGVFMSALDHRPCRAAFRRAECSIQPHAGRTAAASVTVTRPWTHDTTDSAPSIGALAWRQTLRDFRAGELRLLALAVLLAVAALTAVGFFADRLNQGLARDAGALLGGDAVVGSDKPAPPELLQRATALGLQTASSASFPSMGRAPDELGGASRLVAVKAVSDAYPLRGQLRLKAAPEAAERNVAGAPARGTVWVDAALLDGLQLKVGDDLLLGDTALEIAQIIVIEPDRGAGFMSFAPRVMLNQADLADTGLIQPASRVSYRLALAAPPGREAALRDYVAWAEAADQDACRCAACASNRCRAAGPRCARRWTAPRSSSTWWRCCRRCWPRWRWASPRATSPSAT